MDDGERADISWISTEDVDRARDVVLAKGIKDDFFKLNPVVTMNHNYLASPAGRSLWRKWVRDGDRRGIKPKTHYPEQPTDWPSDTPWMPQIAFSMVKAGLLNGKSIGFVPTRTRLPTDQEIRKSPELETVRRIVEECYLVEYCVCPFPVQQFATVQAVSKCMDVSKELWELLGIDPDALKAEEEEAEQQPPLVVFTPLSEVQKHLALAIHNIDLEKLAQRICDSACHTLRGGI